MSNFDLFAPVTEALPGFAPQRFIAVTPDSYATITAVGYMNDKGPNTITGFPTAVKRGEIKANDIVEINYSETGTFPAITSTYGVFQVVVSGSNYSLVPTGQLSLSGYDFTIESTVGFAGLASAGKVNMLAAASSLSQYKIRSIVLTASGTNFSGGGGNRALAIQTFDGSIVYTVVTAALLQAQAITPWGQTGVPYPSTVAWYNTATVAGQNLVATYSGGTTDYTAGSAIFVIRLQKVA